jgi:membrane-associated PAP2 superfamily phosphatase
MKRIYIFFASLFVLTGTIAQDSVNVTTTNSNVQEPAVEKSEAYDKYPYKTSFRKDAPVITAGIGLSVLGLKLIKDKKDLTLTELATKTYDKVPSFDRGNAGYYDDKINDDSYLPFHASFAMPVVMLLLNKNERRNASSVLVMYLESLSITSALFTLTAGTIHRPRPLVFQGSDGTSHATVAERIKANNQRSFYAGHTAASATGTFFAAKVFSDLNPDSKLRPFVWAIAAAIPATVGYMRYKSGYHFLSDNILGYLLGAASGILIPEWHKKGHKNLSFVPQIGNGYKGMTFVYNMK